MTQLIINGIELPYTRRDRYMCYSEEVGEEEEMLAGNLVREVVGERWVIQYAYDYFKEEGLLRRLLQALRSGRELDVTFLTDESDVLQTGKFICSERPMPQFAWARNGASRWHNVNFTLKAVDVHA